MITQVASTAVLVGDANKAAQWYKDKLGFEVGGYDHWATVKPKGSAVPIHLWERCSWWEADDHPGGNTGIYLQVDDLAATVQELKARGVGFAKDVTRESWCSYAVLEDPDGNRFTLR